MTQRRRWMWAGAGLVSVLSVLGGGCASAVPTYPPMSAVDALATIATRQAPLKTVSAECDITLESADGERVRLDGALVAEWPGKIRLKAWKLGRGVLDVIRLSASEAWVEGPGEEAANRASAAGARGRPPMEIGKAIAPLGVVLAAEGAELYRRAVVASENADVLVLRVATRDDAAVSAAERALLDDGVFELDRATLTFRRFRGRGDAAEVTAGAANPGVGAELVFSEYELVEGIPWPRVIVLRQPGLGVITIRSRGVEVNGELAEGAFTPPGRAKRAP
ncbi:hypothetical protein BH11PLA1_BH11PLA1_00830 [soil metagenome]